MHKALQTFVQLVQQQLKDEKENPVSTPIPADALFTTVDLSLPEEALSDEQFSKALTQLVRTTPKTTSERFFNQLFGGRNEEAVLGDLLAVILNNSMYTYKVAGPQVGVEKVILNRIIAMIGWDEQAGGTFAAGGSMTNFMGMLMGRDHALESIRHKGFQEKVLTVYTSEDSHYSTPKNAAFAGIGRDQVRYIPTDNRGVMLVKALEKSIREDLEKGYIPSLVNLTAGTTVLGSFDPIEPVAAICKKYNIWLHVDGAYCGAVLLSKKYKHLIQGVELVDSFSFNAHKMLGTPLSCSLLVVKDKKYLYDSFSNDANYLYQTDHDEFNLGKTSLQCGRRNDALKLWTLWKSIGTKGLEAMVDHQFALADCAREYVQAHPDYTVYSNENSVSVCFNYKNIPARELCTLLYEKSQLVVGYGSFKGNEFVRLVTVNANNSKEQILNFFKVLEQFVAENEQLLLAKGEV